MKKTKKNKLKMSNEMVFEAIKVSLIKDMNTAYKKFNSEMNVTGISMRLNTMNGFGYWLYSNPEKIQDLAKYLAKNLDFPTKILFTKEGDEELFPLIEE